jgi:HAMP domain-containing protein
MADNEVINRRKLTNMFIDPRLQILLFLPYLVTLIGFVLTNLLIIRYVIVSFGQMNSESAATQAVSLTNFFHDLMIYSSAGLITASVIGFVLVILISHRLLGPLYNIHRHVRRLKAGEYHHKITLRKGDRLVELADDLNAVTDRISALAGSSSPRS